MSKKPEHSSVRSALLKAARNTPLGLFENLTPAGDTASERFNAELEDGTKVVFQRRTTAVQQTDALRQADDGSSQRLPDGTYKLADGTRFTVNGGRIDFGTIMADPDGVEPFREYHAWREVVAIDNPLLTLSDPSSITDVVRFLAPDGNSYYAVQQGVDKPYHAYVVADRALRPLTDGSYPLPAGRSFKVEGGTVHGESLADLKLYAYKSTRLPL
jgi:hypothetical protein